MSTEVEQIKERLDIVDVISSYIKVEKAGINFKARCPFHNEKTPSFFISPTRQSFYCFGCQEKGDVFSFVEKFESLDFKGALETLAKRAGVELKKFKKEDRPEKKDSLLAVMEAATKIYEMQLKETPNILEYLEKRGLSSASILKWRLGFAKDEWRSLYDQLTSKGFGNGDLLEAGLLKKTPDGNKYYDTFRNRIMFPISDTAGRVIAFSGRAVKENERTPKYLNSPETKLFYKSEVLYGFHIAKNHIRKLDYTVLVEGQMDLIMSHQAGVANTVASSGTALTELHLKKMQKLSNRIVIAYDADLSGEKAARKAAEMAMLLGMEVKIASLPKGEDPASVAKKEPAAWKKAVRESEHFVDFALNKALKENKGRNLAKEVAKNVLPLVLLTGSDMEKTQLVKKIASKMGINEQDVWNDLKKTKPLAERTTNYDDKDVSKKYSGTTNLDRILTGIVFWEESSGKESSTKKKWQTIVGKDEVAQTIDDYEKEKEILIFEAEKYSIESDIEKILEDVLQRVEIKNLKQKLQQTTVLLDDADLSEEEEKKLKSDLEKIQNQIKKFNNY